MNPGDGLEGQDFDPVAVALARSRETVETMLFESLIHHLFGKGILTRNDALSIVQTVAEVKRGRAHESELDAASDRDLALLKRLYTSFEMMTEPRRSRSEEDGVVVSLRPPLNRDHPEFPNAD